MSDFQHRRDVDQPSTAADPRADGPLKPGAPIAADREWAQNRIANFMRGQNAAPAIMRKAAPEIASSSPAPIALSGGDAQYLAWCRKAKMAAASDTTRQLYDNRGITVQAYVAKFRSGAIKGVMPAEAGTMTVEAALQAGEVGGVNVRKLLQDNREKFQK